MRKGLLLFAVLLIGLNAFGQALEGNQQVYLDIYRIHQSDVQGNESGDYRVIAKDRSVLTIPFSFLLWTYKSFISEQLSSDCTFHPSCSRFSYRAIHELGLIKGVLLTADRLTRCNADSRFDAPWFLINKENAKVYDAPSFYRFSD